MKRFAVVSIIFFLAAAGCVSTGTYKKLESDKAVLEKQVTDLGQQIDELSKVKQEKEQVELTLKQKEELLSQEQQTKQQLQEKLKSEIDSQRVTISELEGKLKVNLVDKILFDSGQAALNAEGKQTLAKVAEVLSTLTDKAIHVQGHTDDVPIAGSLKARFDSNWELSAARALAVVKYFENQGVDPSHLIALAYGEHHPMAPNDSSKGRAQNRRIDIVLTPEL